MSLMLSDSVDGYIEDLFASPFEEIDLAEFDFKPIIASDSDDNYIEDLYKAPLEEIGLDISLSEVFDDDDDDYFPDEEQEEEEEIADANQKLSRVEKRSMREECRILLDEADQPIPAPLWKAGESRRHSTFVPEHSRNKIRAILCKYYVFWIKKLAQFIFEGKSQSTILEGKDAISFLLKHRRLARNEARLMDEIKSNIKMASAKTAMDIDLFPTTRLSVAKSLEMDEWKTDSVFEIEGIVPPENMEAMLRAQPTMNLLGFKALDSEPVLGAQNILIPSSTIKNIRPNISIKLSKAEESIAVLMLKVHGETFWAEETVSILSYRTIEELQQWREEEQKLGGTSEIMVEYLNNRKKLLPFTMYEDQLIEASVFVHGEKWLDSLKTVLPTRSKGEINDRKAHLESGNVEQTYPAALQCQIGTPSSTRKVPRGTPKRSTPLSAVRGIRETPESFHRPIAPAPPSIGILPPGILNPMLMAMMMPMMGAALGVKPKITKTGQIKIDPVFVAQQQLLILKQQKIAMKQAIQLANTNAKENNSPKRPPSQNRTPSSSAKRMKKTSTSNKESGVLGVSPKFNTDSLAQRGYEEDVLLTADESDGSEDILCY